MLNINAVLNKMCEPFMDASFSKVRPPLAKFLVMGSKNLQIDKIDIDYFRKNPRLDIIDETKLNADEDTAAGFYSKKAEGTNNFISEVFFLNVAAHHYGLGACEVTHDQLAKDIGDMEKHLEKIKAERQKWLDVGVFESNQYLLITDPTRSHHKLVYGIEILRR